MAGAEQLVLRGLRVGTAGFAVMWVTGVTVVVVVVPFRLCPLGDDSVLDPSACGRPGLLGFPVVDVDASVTVSSFSVMPIEETGGSIDVHCAELDDDVANVVDSTGVEGTFVEETYCTST